MTETRFNIIFDGELMPDVSLEQAQNNLATLFKSSAERVSALFSGGAVVLKRDLAEQEARQYQQALENAGAKVRMEAQPAEGLSLEPMEELQPRADESQVVAEPQISSPTLSQTPASPYAPPRAQVSSADSETGELKIFGVTGRIGRLRYLAWSFVLMLLVMPVYMIGAGLMMASEVLGALVLGCVVIVAVVISIQIGVKRLHDIGWSGWLLLVTIIPLVGSIFSLIMLVAPGTPGSNTYGAPPPANSTAVLVLAWLLLGTIILGLIALFSAAALLSV